MIKKYFHILLSLLLGASIGLVIYLLDKTTLSHIHQLIALGVYAYVASIIKNKLIEIYK
ncbi:hypothetical protein [Streptobacillus notomytis]|uniref:hypothetical protein n=1 Tax=Streptobacillus notomytis TaxID=1712031 RepID=UPI000AF8EE7E|nr:hypothetical protein [Streptobacillus notomytis]